LLCPLSPRPRWRKSGFQSCYQIFHRYFSTTSRLWVRGNAPPRRRDRDRTVKIANRLDGLTLQQGTTIQTGYEILHTFSHPSNHLPPPNRRPRPRFSENAATEGPLPRAAGKI